MTDKTTLKPDATLHFEMREVYQRTMERLRQQIAFNSKTLSWNEIQELQQAIETEEWTRQRSNQK